mmetsp:Transcript_20975/g.45363  ORF Transcript_20975/g.45363 Transcript_20975/m.45363 type:complete len:175 (-) Transcript_20975:6-530(-)
MYAFCLLQLCSTSPHYFGVAQATDPNTLLVLAAFAGICVEREWVVMQIRIALRSSLSCSTSSRLSGTSAILSSRLLLPARKLGAIGSRQRHPVPVAWLLPQPKQHLSQRAQARCLRNALILLTYSTFGLAANCDPSGPVGGAHLGPRQHGSQALPSQAYHRCSLTMTSCTGWGQ